MEETEEPKEKKSGLKTELIVAVCAIVVSLATLVVYIYQARIMIHQAELMQSQQHMSVWPHLESLTTVTSKNGIPTEAYIEVENKGIGPALVKKVVVKLDGKIIPNRELLRTLMGADTIRVSTNPIETRVITPGEKIKAFYVTDPQLIIKLATIIKEKKFEYIICYCSVYNDCWVSKGTEVKEGDCQ